VPTGFIEVLGLKMGKFTIDQKNFSRKGAKKRKAFGFFAALRLFAPLRENSYFLCRRRGGVGVGVGVGVGIGPMSPILTTNASS